MKLDHKLYKTSMSRLEAIYTKHQWYAQGIMGTPALLSSSALSGFILERAGLGMEFSHFLFRYAGDQAEMLYDTADLERLWKHLRERILSDANFLEEIRHRYDMNFDSFRTLFAEIRSGGIASFDDMRLLDVLKNSVTAQCDSVGLGHIIEPISIIGSDEVRERIVRESGKRDDLNKIIADLFEPDEASFLTKEENELRGIAALPEKEQEAALQDHLERYFWLENMYASTNTLTLASLRERMEQLAKEHKKPSKQTATADKEQMMLDLHLSEETKRLIHALNFCTLWQDERKTKILRSLSSLDMVLKEVGRRTNIDHTLVRYLGPYEIGKLHRMSEISALADTLKQRRHGCYYYVTKDSEYFTSPQEFKEISNIHHAQADHGIYQELRGMIANLGTAIGKVKMCTTLDALKDFPDGAVLVAHMTRPEYAPAMKKAAAIVTDEGGITSHAAIVSRELGVPCIIGTKVATKVLHDGDLVEVRANHGYVRILESRSKTA